MSEVKISAEVRNEFGKGGARRTRRAGKVPAVIYGHGAEPRHISLNSHEFAKLLRKGGSNQLIQVDIEGGDQVLVMPKDVQVDPLKDTLIHIDLLIVNLDEKITTDVYVRFTGEAEKGSIVVHESDSLSIAAAVNNIPDVIEISLDGLKIGSRLHASDVVLPEGVELVTEGEIVMASAQAPRASAEDEAADAEAAATAAAAE